MISLHFFPGNKVSAEATAYLLDIPTYPVTIHSFPDGENRIQVEPVQGTVILFCSLDNPNEKLISLAFAVSAFKASGASRIVLVAPYLCYMRQDVAFNEGEAVSQRVIGTFLSTHFDRVITVDPHLHRIKDLQIIFENCKAESLSATSIIADALSLEVYTQETVFVGPDKESEQWVGEIANQLALPYIVGDKTRLGDRKVSILLPKEVNIGGVNAIIVDDMISSGMTIARCAEALYRSGAKDVQVVTVHALCSDEDVAGMIKAGISRIRSSDSVSHPTNAISLAPLLANALKEEVKNDS